MCQALFKNIAANISQCRGLGANGKKHSQELRGRRQTQREERCAVWACVAAGFAHALLSGGYRIVRDGGEAL